MDEASETESQGRSSKVDEDGSAIPAIITDEYFDEITSKCQIVSLHKIVVSSIIHLEKIETCKEKLAFIWN